MYQSKNPYKYGTGRRKSSVARVHLFENGSGNITINGRDINDYFGLETLKLLVDLARAVKLEERRNAMYCGEHINTTEDRAVLHTALRWARGCSSACAPPKWTRWAPGAFCPPAAPAC